MEDERVTGWITPQESQVTPRLRLMSWHVDLHLISFFILINSRLDNGFLLGVILVVNTNNRGLKKLTKTSLIITRHNDQWGVWWTL